LSSTRTHRNKSKYNFRIRRNESYLQSQICEILSITTARPTQSSEPILIPKLRIDLADFPYLHYSSDQRLLTLETCCGYRYGLVRKLISHSGFQGPTKVLRTLQEPQCFSILSSISPVKPIPWTQYLTKKRQLFPGLLPTSQRSIALPHIPCYHG
jgi:hypothetical protein